jgi:preprotein translocase subunit SecE
VNQQSGSELARMLLLVAAVVALVVLVFFGIGYGLGRLLL